MGRTNQNIYPVYEPKNKVVVGQVMNNNFLPENETRPTNKFNKPLHMNNYESVMRQAPTHQGYPIQVHNGRNIRNNQISTTQDPYNFSSYPTTYLAR